MSQVVYDIIEFGKQIAANFPTCYKNIEPVIMKRFEESILEVLEGMHHRLDGAVIMKVYFRGDPGDDCTSADFWFNRYYSRFGICLEQSVWVGYIRKKRDRLDDIYYTGITTNISDTGVVPTIHRDLKTTWFVRESGFDSRTVSALCSELAKKHNPFIQDFLCNDITHL